jgi:hypothetical protein
MKLAATAAAVIGLIVLYSTWSAAAEIKRKQTTTRTNGATQPIAAPKKLHELRTILIERKKASRDNLKNSLVYYEEKLAGQAADYETKQTLYLGKLISQQELENSERALARARQETEDIRQRIAEDDTALSLAAASAEEEMERLPNMPPGGYAETATLIRYNGTANWSPADAGRIARFFRSRFGYPLPVSAMGQSSTHDRMGFDHRDAVDVAVGPDSIEGRSLMEYLRKAKIPFLAFRGKIPNASTGAHIHIGRPSPRLMEAKHRANPSPVPDHRESTIELMSGGH